MLDILNFYRHFRKNRYALALASLSGGSRWFRARQQYAFYRLGMYRTAASQDALVDDWRSLLAVIVSLAACGERERAVLYLQDKAVLKVLEQHQMSLVQGLLAFLPDEARHFLPVDAQPGLKLALSLAYGDQAKVAADLDALVNEIGLAERNPDLYLLRNNALAASPSIQLEGLNAFLSAHGLLPVVLRGLGIPPAAMNLVPSEELPSVDGPLVSILMTAYESAARIVPAIQSLLDQTYRNLEVVVVDDASCDGTGEVVQALARRDPRVRYLKLPVNVGTYVAKTIGLHMARGEFVTCHDSDDWAHPEKIALQMHPLLSDSTIIFSTSHMVRIRDDGYFYARQIYPLTRLNSSSVLFRKQPVLDCCGAWDLVRTGADSEFLARLKLVFGVRAMRRVNKPLSFCAHRPDSLMTQAGTGYDANRMSPTRLDYWESFSHWHINELRLGRVPRLKYDPEGTRQFQAPPSICVPSGDIDRCMSAFGLRHL